MPKAKEFEIWNHEETLSCRSNRVMDALLKAVISHLLRHFNVFHDSIACMRVEACGIKVKLEALTINNLGDPSGRQRVKFCHALNFVKLDIVTLLEFVTFVKVDCDDTWICLSDDGNINRCSFLSIDISDVEIISVVKEGKTLWTIGL